MRVVKCSHCEKPLPGIHKVSDIHKVMSKVMSMEACPQILLERKEYPEQCGMKISHGIAEYHFNKKLSEHCRKLPRIGFWGAFEDSREYFSSDFPDPRLLVRSDWPEDERARVVSYLERGVPIAEYLGYSYCRFGCTHTTELVRSDGTLARRRSSALGDADFSDGLYRWPEGLSHYVRTHKVTLPDHFLDHIKKATHKRCPQEVH